VKFFQDRDSRTLETTWGMQVTPDRRGGPMRIARLLSPARGVGIIGGQIDVLVVIVALTATPATAQPATDGADVASPVSGRSVADTPLGCDGYGAPAGWTHDRTFGNPTANKFVPCTRCNEAKRRLEASGRFRGFCRDTTPGARADLYRFCVACRAIAT